MQRQGLLASLSVGRGRGTRLYKITEPQWEALLDLAGGWPELGETVEEEQLEAMRTIETIRTRRRGHDPEHNRAVELRGMQVATEHFASKGWLVHDCSKNKPYDLYCQRDDERLYVEVKGTTGDGEIVTLTRNEVEHARRYPDQTTLFLLHDVHVEPGVDGKLRAIGGSARIFQPWSPEEENLIGIANRYTVHKRPGEEHDGQP